MAKRWIIGGVWVVLASAGLLACGRILRAEKPTAEKVIISDVIISGNQRMSAEQIKARLHTQVGTEYNPSVIENDVRELYKTHQFSNITTFRKEDGPGKAKIYLSVREAPNLVQKVTFLGAKHIKEGELREIVGINPGMPLNPNLNCQGCQKILAKYEEMGRSFSHCKLIKGNDLADTEVVYQITEGPITEGPKVKVSNIKFIGNKFVSGARLAAQIKSSENWFSHIGGAYNKVMAEREVDELYKYYRGFGYQDVRISLEIQRSTDGSEVTMIFHIHEGERSRVADETGKVK